MVEQEETEKPKKSPERNLIAGFLQFLFDERDLVFCREYEFGYAPDASLDYEQLIAEFLASLDEPEPVADGHPG